MFGALADAGVNIEMISTSEVRITCTVAEDQLGAATTALHAAFALAVPDPLDTGGVATPNPLAAADPLETGAPTPDPAG